MNIGLAFPEVKDHATREALVRVVSGLNAGYGVQHNANDTHGTITATGSIAERKRTVPMGAWSNVAFSASNYTATGTTWTVTAAQQVTLKYTLIGTTLLVTFYINTSTVGGATANLFLTLPLNAAATVTAYGTCVYDDNATRGTGVILAATGTTSPQLKLMKDIAGSVNWSNSAALTIAGQIAFEVSGSI